MENQYNQTELWAWARGGSLEPFVLTNAGNPERRIIRIVHQDNHMDYFYAQTFAEVPYDFADAFAPFGLWDWNERMCIVDDAFAHLGNWNLKEAMQRFRTAVESAVEEEINAQSSLVSDEESAEVEELLQNGMDAAQLEKQYLDSIIPEFNPVPLFLDEGGHIEGTKHAVHESGDVIRKIAAVRREEHRSKRAEEPKTAKEEPKAAKADAEKPEPKELKTESKSAKQESAPETKKPPKMDAAAERLCEALKSDRSRTYRIQVAGLPDEIKVAKSALVEDLETKGVLLTANVEDDGGAAKMYGQSIPASDILEVFKLREKEPIYTSRDGKKDA